MKRIFLFILTNLAVLFVINISLRLLGVDRILNQGGGINFQALLILSAVIGFSGSVVSLLLSKWSAKRMVGAQVIENPIDPTERWLVETVRRHAAAGSRDLRCARRERIRHRLEPQCGAGSSEHRPAAQHEQG
jgi:heat shock protein HtpX